MSIISGKYDAKELREAARHLHTTMETVLFGAIVSGPWDRFQLEEYAKNLGYSLVTLGMVIENARAHREAAEAALKDLREKLDGIPIAGGGDTITAAEMKQALIHIPYANLRMSRKNADAFADRIMHYAAERREPEYSPGTVVRDAKGDYYQRTKYGKWLAFGISHSLEHVTPKRPLEVL